MKKDVKSWEFWVIVAVAGILIYALYKTVSAVSAAGQSASQLVNQAEAVPGQIAGAAGTLAGNVVGFFQNVFGLGTPSDSQGGGSGSGSGSGGGD